MIYLSMKQEMLLTAVTCHNMQCDT